MTIQLIPYQEYQNQVPTSGHHILAQHNAKDLIVYQAFNHQIADFAVKNQKFGGPHYSFSRMSWIKPNFLWMMYRCGWAEKLNQERVLAIRISRSGFIEILEEAVYSSYQADIYETREHWKSMLQDKTVRLQWDPDHDIYGEKEERRAIQLGLKEDMLSKFNDEMILEIADLTDLVKRQKLILDQGDLDLLKLPDETIFSTNCKHLNKKLRLS